MRKAKIKRFPKVNNIGYGFLRERRRREKREARVCERCKAYILCRFIILYQFDI